MVKAIPVESMGINPHIPEGAYPARLAGVVERVLTVDKKDAAGKPTGVKEDVKRWEWTFGVRAPDRDERFTALTSDKMTTKSNAFSYIKSLRGGKTAELDVEFDTDSLVGNYVTVAVKDKQRVDRTGNIQITSAIVELFPLAAAPTPEIKIEGLMRETEDEDEEVVPPTPPVPPAPPASTKKGRK